MKRLTAILSTIIWLSLCCTISEAKPRYSQRTDSILRVLDHTIERRDLYYTTHAWQIDSVKKELAMVPAQDTRRRADLLHDIYVRYQSFQGDSARITAERELDLATKTGDPDAILRARTDKLRSYITTGAFTDAVDIIRCTDRTGVSPEALGSFYFLCNRLYTDISNFCDGTFSDRNARISKAYADSVILTLPPSSYEAGYASIFKTLDDLYVNQKIEIFTSLMDRNDIGNSEKAMIASVIGDLYRNAGNIDTAVYYKALSAILDITSAKRETSSTRSLAEIMFQDGDYDRASKYINAALDDANAYNAPHRKTEIANILTLIDSQRLSTANSEKHVLIWILCACAVILAVVGLTFFFYMRAVRRLRQNNRVIEERTAELEKANSELEETKKRDEETNSRLTQTLANLRENVRIKDEYLGYGFYANSEYIRKIEEVYKLVRRKVKARQADDLLQSLRDADLRKEKEKMLADFDEVFLKLFPSYPARYRSLFPEENAADQAATDRGGESSDNQTLTPEMRIFALIRLGVTDISKIATFLNYSVNTVNTYKTRAKNRSFLDNADFEAAIMEIRSVS